MTITLSSTFATNLLGTSTTAGVSEQFAGGTLVVYSGTPPTGANEALSGNTVLATFTFAAIGGWSAASGGVQNLDFSATTVTASASGTATFFRIISSAPAALVQGSVGTAGADFNLSSVVITSGDNVTITGTPTVSFPVT